MKKILFFICLFGLIGCTTSDKSVDEQQDPIPNVVYRNGKYSTYDLVELSVNGKTHEYIEYRSADSKSLSHWESCKYCKQNSNW